MLRISVKAPGTLAFNVGKYSVEVPVENCHVWGTAMNIAAGDKVKATAQVGMQVLRSLHAFCDAEFVTPATVKA